MAMGYCDPSWLQQQHNNYCIEKKDLLAKFTKPCWSVQGYHIKLTCSYGVYSTSKIEKAKTTEDLVKEWARLKGQWYGEFDEHPKGTWTRLRTLVEVGEKDMPFEDAIEALRSTMNEIHELIQELQDVDEGVYFGLYMGYMGYL